MYISYNDHKRCTKETFLKGSAVYVNLFMYLGVHHRALLTSICEVVFWTVTICNSHKMRQVRNYNRRNLWFVTKFNSWPRLCRGKFSQITLKMCSVYLGEYPSSVLTGIWEVEYWLIFVLIAICIVYNSPNMRCRNEPPDCNLLHWKGALDI